MKSILAAALALLGSSPSTGRSVEITVDSNGFAPGNIAVKKGEATTLVFRRTSDKTCAKEVSFPELGLQKALPLDQPITVEVPVESARTLTFQCGMGMYKSTVVIQ
jgi:plastocyanin domain-containing protein